MSISKIRNMEQFATVSGISRPTLSKYFQDPNSVRDSTRKRIEAALACHDYRPSCINVNAISPGVVDGDHWDGVDAFFAKYEQKLPGRKIRGVGDSVLFGRMGTAQDLTGMAVFPESDGANCVVAQTYNIDGGQWMS